MSLVDSDRQWFEFRCVSGTQETTRDVSFCAHSIENPEPLIIEDALLDERLNQIH